MDDLSEDDLSAYVLPVDGLSDRGVEGLYCVNVSSAGVQRYATTGRRPLPVYDKNLPSYEYHSETRRPGTWLFSFGRWRGVPSWRSWTRTLRLLWVYIYILPPATVVSNLSTHLVARDRRRAAGMSQSPYKKATMSGSTRPNSAPPPPDFNTPLLRQSDMGSSSVEYELPTDG